MRKTLLTAAALVIGGLCAHGQRFAVSTNLPDYAMLGTMNVRGDIALSQHWSAGTVVKYNPWTWHGDDPDRQMQNRQALFAGAFRYWTWNAWSGLWFEAGAQYRQYSQGGIRERRTEEGDAVGGRFGMGYMFMLDRNWNIEVGAGGWAGMTRYTVYSCPHCGITEDAGDKFFILPNDLLLSVVYVF